GRQHALQAFEKCPLVFLRTDAGILLAALVTAAPVHFLNAFVEEWLRTGCFVDFLPQHLLPMGNPREQFLRVGWLISFRELQQFHCVVEPMYFIAGSHREVTNENLPRATALPNSTTGDGFEHCLVSRGREV